MDFRSEAGIPDGLGAANGEVLPLTLAKGVAAEIYGSSQETGLRWWSEPFISTYECDYNGNYCNSSCHD